MRLSEPDQIQFVLLALAETPPWIAVGPQFAASNILQASDLHPRSQNFGLHGPSQERLVSLAGSELNSKLASRRQCVQRMCVHFGFEAMLLEAPGRFGKTSSYHDETGIQRINRLNVAIDCQPADQAVRSARFARRDQARKVGRTAPRCQFVRLHGSHNFTL